MRVAVSAMGSDLEAPFSPLFGRCPFHVFVDTETMASEAVPNQAASAAGGAGIQAAQDVINRGAAAVITGQVGPNAYQVLAAAGVPIHLFGGGTVRQAVEAFTNGRLGVASQAMRPAHFEMTGGFGFGTGGAGGGAPGWRGLGGAGSPAWEPTPSPAIVARTSGTQPAAPAPNHELLALRAEYRTLQHRLEELSKHIDEVVGNRRGGNI